MPLPLVPLDSLPTSGMDVPVGPWAKPAVREAFGADDVSGRLHLLRSGVHVVVTGELDLVAQVPCDRCTATVPLRLHPVIACVYSPISAVPERGEDDDATGPALPELPVAVEDASEYDGVTVDLASVVVESLEVERPARWRCADAYPDDPQADSACEARWRALAGASDEASLSPFAALAGWKPAVS